MFCNSSSTFLLYLCGGLGSAGRLGSGLVNFIAIRRLCCSQGPTPGILSLIIYRTKAESSRETPDFASKCMASVLLFANPYEAMHLDFASKWYGFSFIICESRWSHASRFRFASSRSRASPYILNQNRVCFCASTDSLFLFQNAWLQFFAQKREHLHSTADALYTCSIISNGLYLLFIISFRVLTYVFVGPYLKLLFLSIRRITFANLFSIHLPST